MNKQIFYAVNSATQPTVVGGTTVNFGSEVRRSGIASVSGGNVSLNAIGDYDVDINLTLNSTTAGTVVAQVYVDGMAVPGAISSKSVGIAGIYPIVIPFPVRKKCCYGSVISCVVTGLDGTITNAAIEVVR